jgi:glycerophosphoryl diester phosphodiesterase
MKTYILLLTLCIISITGYSQTNNVQSIIKKFRDPNNKKVLVAAHRGDWRNAPENSILAYQKAIDMGVDIIEVDVQKTKDGHLVIMHDQTVDRTTDGKGRVSDLSLEEIKKLYLRNGLGRVTHHTIPTLEETMLLVKGKVLVDLDKCYPFMNEAYAVLIKTGTLDHGIFKGFKTAAEVRKEYGNMIDKVMYKPIVSLDSPDAEMIIRDFQRELKPVCFELNFQRDTAPVLKKFDTIKMNGSTIWINSLWASLSAQHNDDVAETDVESSWGWIVKSGANVIQTDRPKELIAYLKDKGLR